MSVSRFYQATFGRLTAPFHKSNSQRVYSTYVNEESLARYCIGGYHPVRIGDVFKDGAYKVINKLGYGQYSTVWLAQDVLTKRHVAIKIMTADAFNPHKPTFELDILNQLSARHNDHRGGEHILNLIDQFKHKGPNGEHSCLVFKAMGPDLAQYRMLFPSARIPVPMMKKITKQLLVALSFLHESNQIVHTDIKPHNILIETNEINQMFDQAPSELFAPKPIPNPPHEFYLESEHIISGEEDLTVVKDISIRLADFSTASYFKKHLTEWIQPQMLRAPEVILGASWDYRVDIWNIGVLVWELVEGKVLFDGTASPTSQYTAEAHLAQMLAVLGEMPKDLLARGSLTTKYFDEEGTLLVPSPFPTCSLEGFSSYPESSDKGEYFAFLRSMLRLTPEERQDASELLEAAWLRE